MLTKPLIFTLTFLMSIANFIILLIPIAILFFPLYMFMQSLFVQVGPNVLYFLASRVSFVMLVYLLLDLLFGFAARGINRNSIPIEKANSIYGQKDILETFEWLKKKFNLPKARLYINQSFAEKNAYAVGSLKKKSVTITMGLLNDIKNKSNSNEQYVDAVKGILGHEMSHLSNSDYLPGLLAYANERANSHISTLIRWIFLFLANIFRFVPFVGKYIYTAIMMAYWLVKFSVNIFYKLFFIPVYNFLKKWFSRDVEYRCDRESGYAFGGKRIAVALSMLGEGSYFSVFSTHPRTKSRIKKVENIAPKSGTIRPSLIGTLSNLLSIMLVVGAFAFTTYKADVPKLYQHYLSEVHYPIKMKSQILIHDLQNIYNNYIK